MNNEYEVGMGEGGNPVSTLAYSFQKAPRGLPGLTSSSNEQTDINNTYAFTSHELQRDLLFNPGIFGTETSD